MSESIDIEVYEGDIVILDSICDREGLVGFPLSRAGMVIEEMIRVSGYSPKTEEAKAKLGMVWLFEEKESRPIRYIELPELVCRELNGGELIPTAVTLDSKIVSLGSDGIWHEMRHWNVEHSDLIK